MRQQWELWLRFVCGNGVGRVRGAHWDITGLVGEMVGCMWKATQPTAFPFLPAFHGPGQSGRE